MIRIITDSVASIPAEIAKAHDIEVVSLFVRHAGVEYKDAEMDLDDFYSRIDQMVDDLPTSSQPSQLTLEALFEDAAKSDDEVLGIFISSRMSGTYEGAIRAARSVLEFYARLAGATNHSRNELLCLALDYAKDKFWVEDPLGQPGRTAPPD